MMKRLAAIFFLIPVCRMQYCCQCNYDVDETLEIVREANYNVDNSVIAAKDGSRTNVRVRQHRAIRSNLI